MSQFKWGGRFTAMDQVARAPVSGRVAGTFDGDYPSDLQDTLSAVILQAFNSVVEGLATTLPDATSNLEDLSRSLTRQAADDLSQHGVSGQVTIVIVKLQ